ncbi:helix-turn-helix transcriptional regulator [Leucobacter allii]|uniref:Helix-turn-helix transcriptional regulator n=1 Tax=Leucobacter allii TaxID=2932247 RepID=A0ABY4FLQ6_9MICO|nr:helix-turn-helix transcriptional regulator [Leucobacter allii]UOQ57204.1 helix-turn-helix transcriptional regulator [Leucobacter allii]
MGTDKASNARDIGPMTVAVAEELNALLGRRKVSAARLSREAGIPRTTLHKTLNALRAIDVDDVLKICNHLGEDTADLIGRAEDLVMIQRMRDVDANVGGTNENPESRKQSDFGLVSHPFTEETGELMDE